MRALPLAEPAIHIPEIPSTWTWCLKQLLLNLVFWLLSFGALFLLAYYMQEPASPLH